MPEDGKKGFVLYSTYYGPVSALTDEQAGRLFKAILADVSGEELPSLEAADRTAFSFIKAQMEFDAAKYEKRVRANRQNGTRGGRPPKNRETEETHENPNNPMGYEEPKPEPPAPPPPPAPEKTGRKEYTPEFEELWKLYPNKDDKWNGFIKYQARRKKYSHQQLLSAVVAYLERKKKDRDYPKYIKQLQTFFSSDMADFTQYLGAAARPQQQEQRQDSAEDWETYFNGGKKC